MLLAALAALLLSQDQCVTTGAQDFYGDKTWHGQSAYLDYLDMRVGAIIRGPLYFYDGSGVGQFLQYAYGTGFYFKGNRLANGTDSDFQFSTGVARTAGNIIETVNDIYTPFSTDFGGSVYSGCGPNPDGGYNYCGSFVDNSGISGHLSLTVRDGFYPFIAGQLPENYYGHHGAITFGNTHKNPQWVVEVVSGGTGTAFDKKLAINYQGGILQPAGHQCNTVAFCRNADQAPADGGVSGADAGYAFTSTLQYMYDKHAWCFCDPYLGNGDLMSGWRRMDDNTECCPQ